MKCRALFISRTAAQKAAEKAAREAGRPEREVMFRCKAYPRYRLGELIGYEAWFPASHQHNKPVMEP
jgi:hypothetical protein